jgi:hypothetical protein
MKKLYQIGWSEEGFFYRRESVVIRKETLHCDFQIRRVKSKEGKLEPGECDAKTQREAFKKGNQLVRLMRREQRERQKQEYKNFKNSIK